MKFAPTLLHTYLRSSSGFTQPNPWITGKLHQRQQPLATMLTPPCPLGHVAEQLFKKSCSYELQGWFQSPNYPLGKDLLYGRTWVVGRLRGGENRRVSHGLISSSAPQRRSSSTFFKSRKEGVFGPLFLEGSGKGLFQ